MAEAIILTAFFSNQKISVLSCGHIHHPRVLHASAYAVTDDLSTDNKKKYGRLHLRPYFALSYQKKIPKTSTKPRTSTS